MKRFPKRLVVDIWTKSHMNFSRFRVMAAYIGLLLFAMLFLQRQVVANDLFIAGWFNSGVTRVDGSTGGTVYSGAYGFSPIDLVEGPDGALYVSTLSGSTVDRVDPATGTSLGAFASGGGLSTT